MGMDRNADRVKACDAGEQRRGKADRADPRVIDLVQGVQATLDGNGAA